jgi:hypothetical protein
MDNIRLIFKILTIYKNALWENGISPGTLTPEKLGTTEVHIRNIQLVLRNGGLIIGTNGHTVITLAGLDYLESNQYMKKIAGERNPYGY